MCQWNGSRRQNQQPAPLPLFQHCFLPLNVILVSYIFFGALTDTFSKHQLLSCEVTAEYNPPLIQPAPRGPQTQLLLCRDSQVKKKKKHGLLDYVEGNHIQGRLNTNRETSLLVEWLFIARLPTTHRELCESHMTADQ